MDATRSAALALLFASAALAGCTFEDGAPLSISIPAMGPGESWTVQGGSSGRWVATTTVADQVAPVRDAFGQPVAAWVLTTESTGPGQPEAAASLAAIEAGTGAWLVQSGPDGTDGVHCGDSGATSRATHSYLHFPRIATRHDDGELVGPFTEGETRSFLLDRSTEWAKIVEERTYTAVGHAMVASTAFGDARDVPALQVEVRTKVTYAFVGDFPGDRGPSTHEQRETRYYADGVRIPLRSYSMPDGGSPELLSELTAYTFGGHGLTLSGRLETHQFEARNPDVAFAPFDGLLDDRDLGLEFPQAEALAALARDPRATAGWLWLQRHPGAAAIIGSYERDVDNQTYDWEWWFQDGDDMLLAQATRRIAAGLPVDSARTSEFAPGLTSSGSAPEADGVELTSLAAAHEIARTFEPGVDAWRRMEWFAWQLLFDEHSAKMPAVVVSFLPRLGAQDVSSGGTGLAGSAEIRSFGPGASVDLERGGLAPGGAGVYACEAYARPLLGP